jgi:hypothetical protein
MGEYELHVNGRAVLRAGFRARPPAATEEVAEPEGAHGAWVAWTPVAAIVGSIVLMAVVFALFGYVIAVAVLCIIVVVALGQRSWWRVLLFTVLTTAITYLVFVVALHSRIPPGMFF